MATAEYELGQLFLYLDGGVLDAGEDGIPEPEPGTEDPEFEDDDVEEEVED